MAPRLLETAAWQPSIFSRLSATVPRLFGARRSLYEMALEEFFKDNPQLKYVCLKATEGVEAACSE
ncbi:hypothetical protein JOQ06_028295, partial [Pogonophryne albipinna]